MIKKTLHIKDKMSRKRDKNESEHLRGEIKTLQKQLREEKAKTRQLEKQLSFYEKRKHFHEDTQDNDEIRDSEDTIPKALTKDCEVCGKGKLIETLEILGKIFGTCNHCGQNGRIK